MAEVSQISGTVGNFEVTVQVRLAMSMIAAWRRCLCPGLHRLAG